MNGKSIDGYCQMLGMDLSKFLATRIVSERKKKLATLMNDLNVRHTSSELT